MPAITNTTMKAEVTKIAKVLGERGENWTQELSATVVLRTILGELGLTEELGPEYANERKEILAIIKPWFTAANNAQNSIIALTNGEDGKPLMGKVTSTQAAVKAEFV
jgi:hypothetical protein